jgi:hypothetical protein
MNTLFLAIAAGGVGAAGGIVIGYKIAERNLTVQFEERLLKETDAMRIYYQQTTKKFATPQEAAADLIPAGTVLKEEPVDPDAQARHILEQVAYHKIVQKNYAKPDEETQEPADEELFPPQDETITSNVFEDPKIISQGEFMENPTEYAQSTLTYYEVDQVLTDERDNVIENKVGTIGSPGIFSMFGMDSSDPNTVHVRNPRLQMEFELVRHRGSYAKEILGLDDHEAPERPSGRGR